MDTVFSIHLLFFHSSLVIANLKILKHMWSNKVPLSHLFVSEALNKYAQTHAGYEDFPPQFFLCLNKILFEDKILILIQDVNSKN